MPIKLRKNDDGEDEEIVPAKRDSDTSVSGIITIARKQISNGTECAPNLPDIYDLTKLIQNLHNSGKIIYAYGKDVSAEDQPPMTLENLPHGFINRVNSKIYDVIKMYLFGPFGGFDASQYSLNALDDFGARIKRLHEITKITVVLRKDCTISGVWCDLQQADSPQNDNKSS